jgi:sulfate permease, SulP family
VRNQRRNKSNPFRGRTVPADARTVPSTQRRRPTRITENKMERTTPLCSLALPDHPAVADWSCRQTVRRVIQRTSDVHGRDSMTPGNPKPGAGSERLPSLPVLQLLRTYPRQWFVSDMVAGVSVCVVMIPSVLAYAELAGLAPVYGLYAALAGMIGYALFASSRQVIAGPDAAITLLVGVAVGPLAGGDPSRAAALAAVTALLCGGLMLLAAGLHAGVVADFLSKPVLVGYLSGAALILVSTQLGKLFGIRTNAHDFFPLLREILRRLGETHPLTFWFGIGLIALLEGLRRFAPRVPGAVAVFVVALVISALFNLQSRGVRVIGDVPRGLPGFHIPIVSMSDIGVLFPAAAGIVMLAFPEGILLARAFGAKNRYEIRPNQELVALAAANLATGLFQGFPCGASQSRTTICDAAGGKSQVVSLIAAVALTLFLLFLTPVLRLLPTVALASILIVAGVHLIELHEYRVLFKVSPRAFWLALVVAAGVLVVGVVPGILIGMMVSLIYLLGRLARPMDAVLQPVPGTGRYHDLGEAPEAQTVPGLIAYRFYAPLFFANAEHFVQRVRELIAASPHRVRWFVVDMQAIWEIDVTAAEAFSRLVDELRQKGIALAIARANRPLRERLERIGLKEQLGEATYHPSVHAAIEAFQRESQSHLDPVIEKPTSEELAP